MFQQNRWWPKVALISSVAVGVSFLGANPSNAQANVAKSYMNLTYVSGTNQHERHKLDLWVAKTGGTKKPLVVFIHGGGFVKGDKEFVRKDDSRPTRSLSTALLAQGISVASINYRYVSSSVHFPAPMQDGEAAVRFLRQNAATYNIDTSKICLYGTSAGAGIAQWIAFKFPKAIKCVVANAAQTSYHLLNIQFIFQPNYTPRQTPGEKVELKIHTSFESLFNIPKITVDGKPRSRTFMEVINPLRANKANHTRLLSDMRAASPNMLYKAGAPPVLYHYGREDHPVSKTTDPGAWVHHPRFALEMHHKAKRIHGANVFQHVCVRYPRCAARICGKKLTTTDNTFWKADILGFFKNKLLNQTTWGCTK
ncbi:MAG: alpha/beta hydrolase [Deltaproteobacteria bacterium]|nr:MAG: alpha/beta hydrolase [Deltaproteobacteria bacterium]